MNGHPEKQNWGQSWLLLPGRLRALGGRAGGRAQTSAPASGRPVPPSPGCGPRGQCTLNAGAWHCAGTRQMNISYHQERARPVLTRQAGPLQ